MAADEIASAAANDTAYSKKSEASMSGPEALWKALVPAARMAIGHWICKLNDDGGLLVSEQPKYQLQLVPKKPKKALDPEQVIDELRLTFHALRAGSKGNVDNPPSTGSSSSSIATAAASSSSAVAGAALASRLMEVTSRRAAPGQKQEDFVLEMRVDLGAELRFADDAADLQLHSDSWWSPTLEVDLDMLRLRALVQILWDLRSGTMTVAFLDRPKVQWDIDVSVLTSRVPMPFVIEDNLLPLAVSIYLWSFDEKNPFVIPTWGFEAKEERDAPKVGCWPCALRAYLYAVSGKVLCLGAMCSCCGCRRARTPAAHSRWFSMRTTPCALLICDFVTLDTGYHCGKGPDEPPTMQHKGSPEPMRMKRDERDHRVNNGHADVIA